MTRRDFSRKTKAQAFARSGGKCEICTARLMPGKVRYDHRIPDALGGEPTLENCVVQCITCDKPKTADDIRRIRKADRQRDKSTGALAKRPSFQSVPFPKAPAQRRASSPLTKPMPARRFV